MKKAIKRISAGFLALLMLFLATLCASPVISHDVMTERVNCGAACHGHNTIAATEPAKAAKRKKEEDPRPLSLYNSRVATLFGYIAAIASVVLCWRNRHAYLLHQQFRF